MAVKLSKVIGATPDTIRVGKVRFSFAYVMEPNPKNDPPKYTCHILIDKDDIDTIALVEKAIAYAEKKGAAEKWDGKVPKYTSPLQDGDSNRPDDPAYAGMYYLSAKNSRKPDVRVRNTDGLTDERFRKAEEGEFYSGCYGAASITFYPFAVNGNKGVAVSLNNLVKLEDGESLGGGSSNAGSTYDDID